MSEWIPVEKKLPEVIHPNYGDRVPLPGVQPEWWESDYVLLWYEHEGKEDYGIGLLFTDENKNNPCFDGVDCAGWYDLSSKEFNILAWMPLPKPYKTEMESEE